MTKAKAVATAIFCSIFAIGGTLVAVQSVIDVFNSEFVVGRRVMAAIAAAVFGWAVYVGVDAAVKTVKDQFVK